MRAIAVDWSGRKTGAAAAIRLAEASDGLLRRVEGGRDREGVIAHLIDEAHREPDLIVGLDFAFSLPAKFLRERGLSGAPDLWKLAAREGERWLSDCDPPFWGRPGRRRPAGDDGLRATDREVVAASGMRPRSPFQVSGAGSVGAGSIRGFPFLDRLRRAGFAIWPWDDPKMPVAVEFWPRIAIGSVTKIDPQARRKAVRREARIPPALRGAAAETEDSFDAAMSALWLDRMSGELLGKSRLPELLLEGCIWSGAATSG